MTITVARTIIAVACVGGATILAYYDRSGWGWLVFVAVIAVVDL